MITRLAEEVTLRPRNGSIRDVARQAGVSIATVSRVFNDAASVSPDTRARIIDAAALLSYEPSSLGRNLVRGRSYLVGLIVPNISVPLYGTMLHGIEDVLAQHKMSALLGSSLDRSDTEIQVAQGLLGHSVDAGIVINSRVGVALPVQRMPDWVHISPEIADLPYRVELDNEKGGRLAALELLAAGHRAIGYVGAVGRESAERERGFAQELALAGLDYRRATGDYSETSGLEAGQEMLREPLDAVFVAGDLMAAGVLRALHDAGLSVPSQVAVIGFDDSLIAPLLYPRLTSVRQPAYEMGAAAAQLALDLINQKPATPKTFMPQIVRRESTRAFS
ncbi:LacI family DNA-binding transcriptional regulator [Deinococcus altitudinis]|uniref:LacI family DNA-binding transcriptional regulator n=1 Tax=Deinococcus altitudinis TaxID=468914 RepID=UPI003891442A